MRRLLALLAIAALAVAAFASAASAQAPLPDPKLGPAPDLKPVPGMTND